MTTTTQPTVPHFHCDTNEGFSHVYDIPGLGVSPEDIIRRYVAEDEPNAREVATGIEGVLRFVEGPWVSTNRICHNSDCRN